MNSHERIKRTYEHKETDRVPIVDNPWAGTIRRWKREGMPNDADWRDYFGVDKTTTINVDVSPRFESKIIEETDRYRIKTTNWGTTIKEFKEEDSTPEMLDFKVTDAKAWIDAKARVTVDDDRIPWDWIKNNFDKWRADGHWIRVCFWFGFDITHSHMMGTENLLIAMIEEPELLTDMFDTLYNCNRVLYERIWDAGYHFDEAFIYDDMGYKGTAFFSNDIYKELIQPYHKRFVKWAHDRDIYAYLHSCGNIMKLLPDVIDSGFDCLNPLEVKAGMDAYKVKKEYGDKIVIHGGTNAAIWKDTDAILAEIREKLPILKENGGYIFASDHSIPNDVTLDTMKQIVAEVKKLGTFN